MIIKKFIPVALSLLVTGCAGMKMPDLSSMFTPAPEKPTMPTPKVAKAWLDDYEPKVREAVKGSKFEVERQGAVLVVTAPVDSSFNPDRPSMLMPSSLGPISRVAKLLETDPDMAVLVLGHADSTGKLELNRTLSQERARAFTSIFRMSGLRSDRLMVKGMGPDMPRAANDSVAGRALNRRVEMVLTAKETMAALVAKYNQPITPENVQVVAKTTPTTPAKP
ncbi:OmpA family protein [Pseudomonas marincola]|uniref:OmpA family protein n=1 Tax=Pseudomonas TaxID=286 RepID=UPI0008EB9A4C|nr:Outer membrane protein OmpA [Pseudomonas marincola]